MSWRRESRSHLLLSPGRSCAWCFRWAALFLSYPTFTVPFCTSLLIGFVKALPTEREEAALVEAPPG